MSYYIGFLPFYFSFTSSLQNLHIYDIIIGERAAEVEKKNFRYCNMSNAPTQNGARLEQHVSIKCCFLIKF